MKFFRKKSFIEKSNEKAIEYFTGLIKDIKKKKVWIEFSPYEIEFPEITVLKQEYFRDKNIKHTTVQFSYSEFYDKNKI